MTARDWIIVIGAAASLPVWCYAAYNQWSKKPGATERMIGGCVIYALILLAFGLIAYIVG